MVSPSPRDGRFLIYAHKFILNSLCVFIAATALLSANILYVAADASGSNDGSSWANAYTVIRTAYDAAEAGDEIWVKHGTYKMSSTGDKSTFITLKADVALYGGFSGDEIKRQERRWWEYETILSGDLNDNDNSNINSSETTRSDNSYMCFYGISTNINTIIDGFTVTGFNGKYTDITYTNHGAGLYVKNNSVTVRNCHFTKNAAASGAAIYSSSSDSRIVNCFFDKNYAFNMGYVLSFYSGTVYMSHCVVYENDFPSNMSPKIAASFYYAKRHVTNNIIYNNVGDGLVHYEHDYYDPLNIFYNIIENSVEGTGNITSDPAFRNTTDFTLQSSSPAIDSGTEDIRIYDIDDADCDGNISEVYPLDYYGFQRGSQPDRGIREFGAARVLVNGITAYPGILTTAPTISWMFDDLVVGTQLTYRVQVSTDSTFSTIDMWDLSSDLDGDSISYAVYFDRENDPETALDTVSCNYYRLKLTDGEDYRWKILAFDEHGAVTETGIRSFTVNSLNSAPAAFALSTPYEGVCDTLQPVFSWHPSADTDPRDAVTYTLTLGSSPENISAVYSGTDTCFTPNLPLPDNTILYWSVTARDKAGAVTVCDNNMSWFAVNTANDAPGAAAPVAPDSTTALSRAVTFAWSKAADPDPLDRISYTLMLNDGDSLWHGFPADSTTLCLDTLEENARYRWTVTVCDLSGACTAGDTAAFWTDFQPEAPAEVSRMKRM